MVIATIVYPKDFYGSDVIYFLGVFESEDAALASFRETYVTVSDARMTIGGATLHLQDIFRVEIGLNSLVKEA